MKNAKRLLLLPLLVCGLAPTEARAQRMNLVEGEEVLAFARGLASEFSFVDLAAEVLKNGEDRGFPSSMSERIALEKCSIFGVGARSERDVARRHELFEEALLAYQSFIDGNSRSDALPDAEAGFVDTSADYAQSMLSALETAIGEEAETLRQRRIEVLTDAVAKTGELIEGLKSIPEKTEAQKRRLHGLMLNRGRMLTETARSQDDPTFSFEQAQKTLEELTFEAGENSPYGLRAFDAMAANFAAQGRWQDAAYTYEFVVNTALPRDPAEWAQIVEEQQLDQQEKEVRWLFLELSTRGLVEAWANAGETGSALSWALHFYNTQKREGFTYSVPGGYLSLLAVAKALTEAGGFVGGNVATGEAQWYATEEAMKEEHSSSRRQRSATDLALSIAQEVKSANRGNSLQVRAQKLIKEIIERPGVKKSPDVLMDAAMGEYNERNYGEAINAFKDVLAALEAEDEATRTQYGPDLMFYLGRCYRAEERDIEAAICFQQGVTTYLGDDAQNGQNAKGYLAVAKAADQKFSGADAEITALRKDAEQKIIQYGGGDTKDALLYSRAEKARRDKEYAEAIELYQQIEAGSDYYEKALVNVGLCKLRGGSPADAVKIFDEYLNHYVTDPKNAIAQSETRKTRRKEAMANAEFYRGYLHFKRAEKAKDTANVEWSDPSLVEAGLGKVLELLPTFYQDYPEQRGMAPATMRMVALGHLASGDVPAARSLYEVMLDRYQGSQQTSSVGLEVYKILEDDQKAAQEAGDGERAEALLREMVDLIRRGNQTASTPSFQNLRTESRHWMDLGEFEKAEAVLEDLVAKFGDSEAEDMEKYVLPDLAEAYLEQKKVADALEVLEPLNAEGTKPAKSVVLNYCYAILGWVEENENGSPTVVPGATQDPEKLEDACEKLGSVAASANKYEGEWYTIQFQFLYGYYVWGQLNSTKLDTAKRNLASLQTDLGDPSFQAVETELQEAGGELAEEYGNHVLRKRYVWLKGRLGV